MYRFAEGAVMNAPRSMNQIMKEYREGHNKRIRQAKNRKIILLTLGAIICMATGTIIGHEIGQWYVMLAK